MTHSNVIFLLSMGTLLVIFGWPALFSIYNKNYWEKGIFPPFKLNRKVNRYEAIINIAVHILLCSRDEYKKKQRFLQGFLYREFPSVIDPMSESLSTAISQRLTIESTVFWLNKVTIDAETKKRYLRMLFEMAAMDGMINSKEKSLLNEISRGLFLSDSILNEWIDEAVRFWSEKQKEEQNYSFSPIDKSKEKAAILGLAAGASMEEIKRAYRKMVKLYHPDTRSSGHKASGDTDRFLEIQEAYEYLTENEMKS